MKKPLALALVLIGLAGCLLASRWLRPQVELAPMPPQAERLIPTPTRMVILPTRLAPATSTPRPAPTATPFAPQPTPTLPEIRPTAEIPWIIPAGGAWRYGVVDRLTSLDDASAEALGAGWYLRGVGEGAPPPGRDFVYLVPVRGDTPDLSLDFLRNRVVARPGSVWQIGNEPDVSWQSNCTPEQYARVYHQLYSLIKQADPTALVAAGAISQATPLRRLYLDQVLVEYQRLYHARMPVDIWTIHAAILREEQDGWGVDIPPGLANPNGQLVEVGDNDRLDLFEQQIYDFRSWMRQRGYRDRPLAVTEFSILMPFYYGFDTQRVAAFMTGALDLMRTAADPDLGYPADGYRLVQRWAWYALTATDYPTGNLVDPHTGWLTPLGEIYAGYVAVHSMTGDEEQ